MAYFIIFLAMAAVLGPLMAVLPSKRQKQLADFRERARCAGVRVTLKSVANIPPRLQRLSDEPLVGYGMHLTPAQAALVKRDLYVRSRHGWEAESANPPPTELDVLPENAEIVVVNWDEIAIYWNEKGGDEALQKVFALLQSWHPGAIKNQSLS